MVVRPTFVPEITGVAGNPWVVGKTSEIKLLGTFSPGRQVIVGGDGVLQARVLAVDSDAITIEVTAAATATPGLRAIFITSPAPALGAPPGLGSVDRVEVTLNP